jgi:hypothetical protein
LVTSGNPLVTSGNVVVNVPDITRSLPQVTNGLPQVTNGLPQATTSLPQVTNGLPDIKKTFIEGGSILRQSYVPQIPVGKTSGYRFIKDILSQSSEPREFSLLAGGVTIPTKLPDVLLEMC